MSKISIRFFNDREVRAVWDEANSTKNRNYWKCLKTKLKNEGSEVVSVTNQLKLLAPDGKQRLTEVLDYNGVISLAKSFPNARASRFVEGNGRGNALTGAGSIRRNVSWHQPSQTRSTIVRHIWLKSWDQGEKSVGRRKEF